MNTGTQSGACTAFSRTRATIAISSLPPPAFLAFSTQRITVRLLGISPPPPRLSFASTNIRYRCG
jgi:hypothetical protein